MGADRVRTIDLCATRKTRAIGTVGLTAARIVQCQTFELKLLAITTPEPWDRVHTRLGTTPASGEDFSSLTGELGSPDGEG